MGVVCETACTFPWHHFFSLNQLRSFGFPVFPVTYTFFSDMKLRACTFQCNHTVYISLSVGNATEEKRTTLDQPINCHSILHHHQTNGHECTFIISVLFLLGCVMRVPCNSRGWKCAHFYVFGTILSCNGTAIEPAMFEQVSVSVNVYLPCT